MSVQIIYIPSGANYFITPNKTETFLFPEDV